MRLPGHDNVHLTYCLNVHPGGTLAEAEEAVFRHAKAVFAKLAEKGGPSGPYGLGAWLSAEAAGDLTNRQALDAFIQRLADEGAYVFTLNGFPYAKFHGTTVKRQVYRPDWSEPSRRYYTVRLARILGKLLPDGVMGTISTLPITYQAWADEPKLRAAVENLAEVTAALADLERDTGREICLALEPEPDCFLERTDDVLRFFSCMLLPLGSQALAGILDCSTADAKSFLLRHVGVCLDAIHAAVRFEDPTDAVRRITAEGIRVAKVHLGAALDLTVGADGPPAALAPFKEDVYLHQVTCRTDVGEEVTYPDLPDAYTAERFTPGRWRVHYHVPLTWKGTDTVRSTAGLITPEFLRTAIECGVEHFELETYTLGVFPGTLPPIEDVMSDDLLWLLERFAAAGGS
ncbi:metabolite traffic protein EboE [bacterium]|nr:metabolite traffic protein EboE [bacterium]